jgi:hypothetical protein
MALSGCQDFFGTVDLKQMIKEEVIDATAPLVSVNIVPPPNPSMGAPSPVGMQSWKVGVPYTITTSVGEKYAFAGWVADAGDVTFGNAAETTTTFKVNADFAGTITVTPNFDTRPKVIYVDPVGNGIPINKAITIKFSENVDPATVILGTSVLVTTWPTTNPAVDPISIHANLNPSISGTLVTLSPSSFYEKYYTILVSLTPGIRDMEGNPMADDYSWYFATTGTEDDTAPAINSFTIRNAAGIVSAAASKPANTNGTAIRLNISATDDQYQVWKMRVIETPCDAAGNDLGLAVDHGIVAFSSAYNFTLAEPAEGWTKIVVMVADELDNWTVPTNTAIDTKIVQMDTTAPSAPTGVAASPDKFYGGSYWYSTGSGVAFTPAGASDGGSGIMAYSTSSDGSGFQTPSLTRGSGTYALYSVDNAGNASVSGYGITVKQDAVDPDTPLITSTNSDYEDPSTSPDTYWFKDGGVTFSLSSADNLGGSGLKGFTANADGSGTQASSLTLAAGTHTIYAVDNVGNIAEGPSVLVKLDNTQPNQPGAAPRGTYYDAGGGVYWTAGAAGITFDLSASDNAGGSGVDHYLIDGTNYPASTASILLAPQAGAHSIYAVDRVGLSSTLRSVTVKQDSSPPGSPAVDSSDAAYEDGSTYWYTAVGVEFTFTSTDGTGSGIKGYTTDSSGISPAPTLSPIASTAGTFTFYAVDQVGRVSDGLTVMVKLDNTAPNQPGAAPSGSYYDAGGGVYWTAEAGGISFGLSASDNAGGSGVSHYLIDGSGYPAATASILLAPQAGAHSIYAVDRVGLQSSVRSVSVKLDADGPSMSGAALTASAAEISGFTSSDGAGSGLNAASYTVTSGGSLAGSFNGSTMSGLTGSPGVGSSTDYLVYAEDNAGNGTAITVRLSQPTDGDFSAQIIP